MPDTMRRDVAAYLIAALEQINDLTGDAREELADSIESAVCEVAAEFEDDLELLLGPPEQFAAELRAAAGFAPPTPARGGLRRYLNATVPRPGVASITDMTGVAFGWLQRLFPELLPAWWILRGYAIAVFLAWLPPNEYRFEWLLVIPVPHLLSHDSMLLSTLGLVAAVVGSVQLGRKVHLGWKRWAVLALNILAVATLLDAASTVQSGLATRHEPGYREPLAADPLLPTPTIVENPINLDAASIQGIVIPSGELVPVDEGDVVGVFASLAESYGAANLAIATQHGMMYVVESVGVLQDALDRSIRAPVGQPERGRG